MLVDTTRKKFASASRSYEERCMTPRRIVGYGCSLTAGTELGDHIVLGKSIEETDALKRSMPLYDWYSFERKHNLEAEGRQRSWVAHLAQLYSASYDNRAQSGASLDQCLLRMKNSLHAEHEQVIVGLTYIQRALKFDQSLEIIAKHQDLETACWNWYRALDQMCDMSCWFVDISDCKASIAYHWCKNESLKAYCAKTWNRAKSRLIPIDRPDTPLHANSHPHESWHIDIARQMKEYIDEQTTT